MTTPIDDFNKAMILLLQLSHVGMCEMINMGDWDLKDFKENIKPSNDIIEHLKAGGRLEKYHDHKTTGIAICEAMSTLMAYLPVVDIKISGQSPEKLKYLLTHSHEEQQSDLENMIKNVKMVEELLEKLEKAKKEQQDDEIQDDR